MFIEWTIRPAISSSGTSRGHFYLPINGHDLATNERHWMAFRIDRAEKKNSYNNLILQELFVFYRRLAYLSVIQLGL